jgi:hypothetical protein
MFSLLNASTFIGRVKAGISTLGVVLAVVDTDSTSLTPFSLPQDFLSSAVFGVPWGPAVQF